MTELEFTGERFVPDKSPKKLEAEHRARYEFALRYIDGRKALDIGCGEGYGSYMMIGSAKSVVGVDIDKKAIDHAKEMYESTNLNYLVADVGKLPFGDREFDAAVCFEVIEHVENPEDVIREAARVLGPRSVFIVSTPNGAVRVSSQPNRFHVKEFNIGELRELLSRHFPSDKWYIGIYGQFQRGKKYSKSGVLLKNLYLGAKDVLGMKPKEEAVRGPGRPPAGIEFDFETENAPLAEFLVAVVKWRD